ncbi:MAG: Hpt domain-containing protein [Alphaproteobacteria bacterium]|nr:Hpt domain-containing protein [Alphaproteobacteria bacterium]
MADDLRGVYAHGIDSIAQELRREFIDEAKEQVTELALLLNGVRTERNSVEELKSAVSRASLKLRAQAGNMGLRLVGTIAHRLEDYMSGIRELEIKELDDLQFYCDRLEDVLEGRTAHDADAAEVVRQLPVKVSFSEADIEIRNIEVMLVMLHGAANHFVQRELKQCGYRVTTTSSVFEAFPLITQTKPDLVLISAMMPELDGIDLAIGLSAMPATRNIPLALVTSLGPDDENLARVPQNIPIIKKGPSFGDDLFTALDNLFLI